MTGIAPLLAAATAFVGTHFLLSHPLRAPLVRAIGAGPFLGFYSLVAAATLTWLALAYRATPATEPLWPAGDLLWSIVSIVTLIAAILLMGSLIRNPALPDPRGAAPLPEAARGVFALTRHPMMWAFALWGLSHIVIFPTLPNLILAGAIVLLALVGAAAQDRKKERLQPDFWRAWQAKTSYWPFAAIATGRARFGGFRLHELTGGVVVWLAATWAHIPLSGWPAGIWRWIV